MRKEAGMKTRRWIAVAPACLAAALCGYLLGHSQPVVGNGSAKAISENGINQRTGPTAGVTRTFTPAPQKERSPEELVALKKHLMNLCCNSPCATHDWALRAQVAKTLATMTLAELEGFATELVPTGSGSRSTKDWRQTLLILVGDAWGVKDPAGCIQKANGWGFTSHVFADWLARDPKAANEWLQRTDLPPDMEKVQSQFKLSQIHQQALTDFTGACRLFESFDAASQQSTLQSWAAMFANDLSKRQELLALIDSQPDPNAAESSYRSLIAKMAEKSPHEAALFIETMNLPEDVKDRLSNEMIAKWAVNEPDQAFNSWLNLGGTEVPKPFFRGLDQWSLNSPGAEEAIQWVNGIASGPAKEQFKSHMIDSYCAGDRYTQAAELSLGLADPKERILELKIVKRKWEVQGGYHSNNWFSKLPPDIRKAVEMPLE